MADYFTNFSLVLRLKQDQQEYALQIAKQARACHYQDETLPESFPRDLIEYIESWDFETKPERDGIWLHSEYGGQDAACAFIKHLLQKYDFAPAVGFEWSHDCSHPQTDAYGGGAAYITATEIETMTTSDWLRSKSC
jgi:hypothetical protein